MTKKKQKYKKLQAHVVKLQEALKKEIYTKNQYYDKVNEYSDIIKELRAQLEDKAAKLRDMSTAQVVVDKPSTTNNGKLIELEGRVEELQAKANTTEEELLEQRRVNDIQAKQLSLYVEELRKCCGLNLDMKTRLEEVLKEKEALQLANDNYKANTESLRREKQDFLEQLQKSLSRETEYKRSIEDLEGRIVRPDSFGYLYNMQKATLFGTEGIQVGL